jgi:hypothetical protein
MLVGVYVIFAGITAALTHRFEYFKSKLRYQDIDRVEAIHRELNRRVCINILGTIAGVFLAALVFLVMEDWTLVTSLYFSVQTAMVRD